MSMSKLPLLVWKDDVLSPAELGDLVCCEGPASIILRKTICHCDDRGDYVDAQPEGLMALEVFFESMENLSLDAALPIEITVRIADAFDTQISAEFGPKELEGALMTLGYNPSKRLGVVTDLCCTQSARFHVPSEFPCGSKDKCRRMLFLEAIGLEDCET